MKPTILSLVLAFLMFGATVQSVWAQDANKMPKEVQDLRHEQMRKLQEARQNLHRAIKADDKAAIETALKQWREAKRQYNAANCTVRAERQALRQEHRNMYKVRKELGHAMQRGNWSKR